jgi:hypothetical protein
MELGTVVSVAGRKGKFKYMGRVSDKEVFKLMKRGRPSKDFAKDLKTNPTRYAILDDLSSTKLIEVPEVEETTVALSGATPTTEVS